MLKSVGGRTGGRGTGIRRREAGIEGAGNGGGEPGRGAGVQGTGSGNRWGGNQGEGGKCLQISER